MGYYYGGYYGIDIAYYAIVLISLILGIATQGYIKRQYSRWSKKDASYNGTGAEVAQQMLASNGVTGVGIARVGGQLTDYYDPRDNQLHLSDENLRGGSVASVAVACHEAGHAVQHAKGYAPVKIRTALVPVVNFTQNVWMIVFLIGVFLNTVGLVRLAILLFAFSVIFQLVTLPVEFNASHRALEYIKSSGQSIDLVGARQVLTAAALTYVAAALVSILQLLYLLGRTGDRD
ncbi:MAG: zinc metallopeptidase [Tractidigestivibacter sp.]|jgi:Zn-dependent membrane protease YugP|uniref:zinc metallopeptidase n=1 Tax=Tractidigestivibacter sp. TaxID=2847320 RepID=UPI003D945A71